VRSTERHSGRGGENIVGEGGDVVHVAMGVDGSRAGPLRTNFASVRILSSKRNWEDMKGAD